MTDLPAVVETHRGAIAALAQRFGVVRLEIFGSAATGAFDEESDVDLLVTFSDMSPAEHADAYFGLLLSLEDLLERRIDLLEEKAVRNTYLLRAIDGERRLLYAA